MTADLEKADYIFLNQLRENEILSLSSLDPLNNAYVRYSDFDQIGWLNFYWFITK